jgi:hypothetical protein
MAKTDDAGSGSADCVNAPYHSSGPERAKQFAIGVGAALEGVMSQ